MDTPNKKPHQPGRYAEEDTPGEKECPFVHSDNRLSPGQETGKKQAVTVGKPKKEELDSDFSEAEDSDDDDEEEELPDDDDSDEIGSDEESYDDEDSDDLDKKPRANKKKTSSDKKKRKTAPLSFSSSDEEEPPTKKKVKLTKSGKVDKRTTDEYRAGCSERSKKRGIPAPTKKKMDEAAQDHKKRCLNWLFKKEAKFGVMVGTFDCPVPEEDREEVEFEGKTLTAPYDLPFKTIYMDSTAESMNAIGELSKLRKYGKAKPGCNLHETLNGSTSAQNPLYEIDPTLAKLKDIRRVRNELKKAGNPLVYYKHGTFERATHEANLEKHAGIVADAKAAKKAKKAAKEAKKEAKKAKKAKKESKKKTKKEKKSKERAAK